MWFRIEQNKDGSIATCTAVEGSLGSRGAVHYIEADTAESACKILLARYATRLTQNKRAVTKRQGRLRLENLCTKCGKNPPAGGLLGYCSACIARKNERRRAIRAGAEPLIKHPQTDAERAAIMRRIQQKNKQKKSGEGYAQLRMRVLSTCLEAFDRMTPRLFREWLAEELHKAREAEQASAQRRSARITKAA